MLCRRSDNATSDNDTFKRKSGSTFQPLNPQPTNSNITSLIRHLAASTASIRQQSSRMQNPSLGRLEISGFSRAMVQGLLRVYLDPKEPSLIGFLIILGYQGSRWGLDLRVWSLGPLVGP